MRFYAPIAKIDAEQRMVWGYASTEARDDPGEVITRDALADALAGYLEFANIREMHQMSAVGVAEEAGVDDKGLYVGARIVDPHAWDKVTSGVYKGFSVGGKVRERDAHDRNIITALSLTEISLVDRPANPEAVFDCWKADGGEPPAATPARGEASGHAALDQLHDGLAAMTDGACCRAETSRALRHLKTAHDALCRAGATCNGFVDAGDAGNDADKVTKAADILSRLDALAKRVAELEATPLPPLTMGRPAGGVSKREDAGYPGVSAAEVIAALAEMSDDERTLALIKAAHHNPIRPVGTR